MNTESLLLGIDLSTTGAKALLVGPEGNVVASATERLALSTPRPLWSEQDPQKWWSALVRSIRSVLEQAGVPGSGVGAVGLTGQMHGLVLLDGAGEVLRPAILWNDQRTGPQCDEIRAKVGRDALIRITGNDAVPGLTAPKILWVQQHEPQVFARARHVLLPKDYIRFRLTGEYAMDKADGSGTQLFDLRTRTWSPEICAALGVPLEWLPPTFEGTEATGTISAAAAAQTGLPAGAPVFAGGGDQAAQAVGVGAIEPGIIALTVGTSGVVFAPTQAALVEPDGRLHAFCHALPGQWHLMGVMLSAAGCLQWYRDTLYPDTAFSDLVDPAGSVPAGSEGLFFLPYLTGERTPYPDPLARAAWIGLTLRHGRSHMTRALLEGVAFGLKDSFLLIQQAGLGRIREVRISGGAARSGLWRQIMADVLGAELVTVEAAEGAAFGAALLAAVGAGVFKSAAQACERWVQVTGRVHPREPASSFYREAHLRYRALYPALAPEFHAAAGLSPSPS